MVQSETPRISVVTPSLNQRAFLEEAITSVLDQGYPNLEYIIIDGGSTDGSRELLERYASHLTDWVSEPDGGQSHAINKGLTRTTGELVGWLNADDFFLPGAFNAVAEAFLDMEDRSSVGFFFGRGLRTDRDGNQIGAFWPHPPAFDLSALHFGFDYILQPATILVRSALKEVGFLDETLNWCMDYDLWMRLGGKYRAIPLDHPMAASREYDQTKSLSGGLDRIAEIARVVERYAGVPATPGVLYYLTTTLRRLTADGEVRDFYSDDFRRCLELLFEESLVPLSVFSDRSPGFPERQGAGDPRPRMAERVSLRRGSLKRLEDELETLHRIVKERDLQLEKMGEALQASDVDRAARLEVIQNAEQRMAFLDSELTGVNAAAAELQAQLTELRGSMSELRERAERAESTLANLQATYPVRIARLMGLVRQ